MGSVHPFLDLNLVPDPSETAACSDVATRNLLTPKIEPKQEAFDEPFQTQQLQQQKQNVQDYLNFPIPDSTTSPQIPPPIDQEPSSPSNGEDQKNVYSEFHRISELFRTAFAKGLQDPPNDFQDPDCRAIVPVPDPNAESSHALAVAVPKRKYIQRSSELVRVTNLSIEDQRYFRDVVRRTRMVYDSLRILAIMSEEKRNGIGSGRRARGDLKASTWMRDRGLWLNRDKRIVGKIPGVDIGDLFFFRMELCMVGLHGHVQAGIDYLPASRSSNGEPIATSIIVSGGYEDDQDAGDMLIYTGHGGQDKFSRQCMHQKLEGGNLALERSMHYGIEIRVIRGFRYENSVSHKVYVYDGLYKILECWFDVGKSGFGVFKYKLVRIEGQQEMGSSIMRFSQTLRSSPLSARPKGYLTLDVSNSKDNVPVLVYNDIDDDHEPLYYDYLSRTGFPLYVYGQGSNGSGSGCDCVSGCTEGCFCALKNGGEFAYDYHSFLVRGKPVIFECSASCQCPPTCRNRVTQHGLRNRLEIFRSRATGWGVRSLDLIHAGAFICEYTGVVLTREQAEIFAMNGDTLIHPNRFSERWVEWGDLSQIFQDYIRPSYPSIPPLDFAMDVSKLRNVACYISQSSSPNVFVQFVLFDHNNLMFPHLMLFAMENIPPLRELSLDYGATDELTGKLAICN